MFSLIILVYLFIGLILFVSTLYLVCKLSLALVDWLDSRHAHVRLRDEEASYQTAQTSSSVIPRIPPATTTTRPRGPTPRYAPHPPRCACPVHVRSKPLTRRSIEQQHGHASLLNSHTNTQTASDLRDDFSRLFSSPYDPVSPPILWLTDTPAENQNVKSLSTAHSTIILHRSSQLLLPPLRQVENVRNTTIITAIPYGPEKCDKRKGWWNLSIGNAVDSRVETQEVTLKRRSTPEKKYEGGYKKGVHRAAYRRSLLETGSERISSSSSSLSSGASIPTSISSASTSITASLPAPTPALAYCFSPTPTSTSFVSPAPTPTPLASSVIPTPTPASSLSRIPVARNSANGITRRPDLTLTSRPNTSTAPHTRKAKIQRESKKSQSRTPKEKENVPAAIPVAVGKGDVGKAGVGRGVGRGAGRQHQRGRGQILQLRVVNN
ncbi:hypothetical protein Moror_14106 [Moniliophthora roreri MCA 2997]|uniref:Uncharacterized protein n=2 Tax=Moniliophthora roreri TaxID=221103 RepID=V2X6P1_MONRO|nr:hypothetical protein Moror_14106 [Moniliophthora roreri MCA 2997]KAI3619629.1 hypothetical protein WG66_002785 [Moniliophthora roreri]